MYSIVSPVKRDVEWIKEKRLQQWPSFWNLGGWIRFYLNDFSCCFAIQMFCFVLFLCALSQTRLLLSIRHSISYRCMWCVSVYYYEHCFDHDSICCMCVYAVYTFGFSILTWIFFSHNVYFSSFATSSRMYNFCVQMYGVREWAIGRYR